VDRKIRVQTDAIVDVNWIAAHIGDPGVRIIEVDVSRSAYDEGHIPGAVLWNAYADLRDSDYRPVPRSKLRKLFAQSVISPQTTIVFYGYSASLGFWLMNTYGHKNIRILEGSRDQWLESGKQWSTDVPKPGDSSYLPQSENHDILADLQSVESAIGKPDQVILDVRTEQEYKGERFWPSGATTDAGRAGHVAGALNIPIDYLRNEDGSLKNADKIRQILVDTGITDDKNVIIYCTIGNRASQAWFALKYLLGFPDVRVYYWIMARVGQTGRYAN